MHYFFTTNRSIRHTKTLRFVLGRQAAYIGLLVGLVSLSGCGLAARQHNVIGREYFESGQFSRAINEFQTALQQQPDNADSYYNLAAAYYTLGKQSNSTQYLGQAEQLLRQAIALDSTHVEAHRTLAVLLVETGRQSFAFDLLNGWQARNPMAADPPIELARLYQEMGDQQRAVNYLADALRLDSYNARALKAMGHIRERQGQWAMALENYSRAYQADARQTDLIGKIQELQTRVASAAYPNQLPYQNPGQTSQF